jgi:hypothetical protein
MNHRSECLADGNESNDAGGRTGGRRDRESDGRATDVSAKPADARESLKLVAEPQRNTGLAPLMYWLLPWRRTAVRRPPDRSPGAKTRIGSPSWMLLELSALIQGQETVNQLAQLREYCRARIGLSYKSTRIMNPVEKRTRPSSKR